MKFSANVALLCTLFATASAQRVVLASPKDGDSIASGSQVTVEVDRPNSLSGSTEVAVVLGLQSCASSPCRLPADGLGFVLYNGDYNPQFQPNATSKPPHQNFTVTIPSTFPKGLTQLGLAHVSLIGAGQAPFVETMNITINLI